MIAAHSALLRDVLTAATAAPGNRLRFLEVGLIDRAGVLATDWQTAFARLKPLTKSELRSQPGQFLAQATDIVYRGKTSGTSAAAFTYFAGRRWNEKRLEARHRRLKAWDIEATVPMVNLASRLFPVRAQDSSLVGKVNSAFLETLLSLQADSPIILRGYPSRLCEVAIALQNIQRYPLSSVVAIIATGECLFESQRSLLTQTFQAPILNEYGCQESGISGLSCPEVGRLHLDSDRCLYEIVDGELLTTDLYNYAMPMVRYSSQDVLKLFSDSCPCGRPGLTAQVLGREEDVMVVQGERRWPGELKLPPFQDILGYQIQLHPERNRLWVQPAASGSQLDLTSLKAWSKATLGEKSTEVIVESCLSPSTLYQQDVDLSGAVDSTTWLRQVREQSWTSWLDSPLPVGEVRESADLLRQLTAPGEIVFQRLPAQALRLVHSLDQSEAASDRRVEGMKIRILLWAIGLIAGLDFESSKAESLYLSALERFRQWVSYPDQAMQKDCSAVGFDLLGPLLTLETQTSQHLWLTVQALIQQVWPQGVRADRLTLHHYLSVLDQAGQKTQRQPHPWTPALRPLSAVLQGDLTYFASTLNPEIVAIWAEIIHGSPGAFAKSQNRFNEQPSDFQSLWQAERRALLRQDRAAVDYLLSRLFNLACSPRQTAQCWLEKGYARLIFGDYIDAIAWVNTLQQQIGLLGPTAGSQSSSSVSNPTPWIPILNVLAPKLIKIGRPDLAYACLFSAAPPNRHLSNFDRQTKGVNGKQSVIRWSTDQ